MASSWWLRLVYSIVLVDEKHKKGCKEKNVIREGIFNKRKMNIIDFSCSYYINRTADLSLLTRNARIVGPAARKSL